MLQDFFKDKTILITGHTGFKGSWLTKMLLNMGAYVIGYSLEPPTDPSLFYMSGISDFNRFTDIRGDIRTLSKIKEVFDDANPEIVFHLAAQPIVLESYKNPVYTYATNVMGTVNVLECIRLTESVRSAVIITTDKVYKNNEWIWGYRENETLDGFDPYSNSKSCAELAVHSYNNSFFNEMDGKNGRRYLAVSTARAGNVIGGGDFADDRIIPDCIRTIQKSLTLGQNKGVIKVRNPFSIRPYQYVLEPLLAYMMISKKQWFDRKYADCYNVGPDDIDYLSTGDLVNLFCEEWKKSSDVPEISWKDTSEENAPHEASFLRLDNAKIKKVIGYYPVWHINDCISKTVAFTQKYLNDKSAISSEMDTEIDEFMESADV